MEESLSVFKSDKFDVNLTESLSLFLYPNSTTIFAKDEHGSNLSVHHYPVGKEKFSEILAGDELLQSNLPISFFVHNENFCLVPGGLFVKGAEEKYLKFSSPIEGEQVFFSSGIESNKVQLLGAVEKVFTDSLSTKAPQVNLIHGASSFLSYLYMERSNFLGQEIFIHLLEGRMYGACFTDQDLVSFGMFDAKNQEDFVKYTRVLIAQHKYKPEHVRVNVFGGNSKIDSSEEEGKRFFHHFEKMQLKSNQNYHQGIAGIDSLGILEAFWQFN